MQMNVMKGISFQIKKNKVFLITFIVMLILNCINAIKSHSGSEYVIKNSSITFISTLFIFLIYVTAICGFGQKDKTINYEVMSGHSRLSVYLGRFVVSGILSYACVLVVILFPTVLVTWIKGWGNLVVYKEILIRFGLFNLVLFRLLGFIVLMTFICKSAGIAAFATYIIYGANMFLSLIVTYILEINALWLSAFTNLMKLTTLSESKLVYIDGKDMMICDAGVSLSSIEIIIVSSLLFGLIYLFAGYRIFKKRDI